MVAAEQLNISHLPELEDASAQEKELIARYKSDPTGPAFFAVSETYRKRGYIDECIAILEAGLVCYPSYVSARFSLAKCFAVLKNFSSAVKEIETVLKQQPTHIAALRFKLKLLAVLGEFQGIGSLLGILGKHAPDDFFSRKMRVHAAMGEWSSVQAAAEVELAALEREFGLYKANFRKESPKDNDANTKIVKLEPNSFEDTMAKSTKETAKENSKETAKETVKETIEEIHNEPAYNLNRLSQDNDFSNLQPFSSVGVSDFLNNQQTVLTVVNLPTDEKKLKKEAKLLKLQRLLDKLERL